MKAQRLTLDQAADGIRDAAGLLRALNTADGDLGDEGVQVILREADPMALAVALMATSYESLRLLAEAHGRVGAEIRDYVDARLRGLTSQVLTWQPGHAAG